VVLEGGVFRFTALGEMWIGKTRLVVRGSDSRGGTVFHGLISAWEKCGRFFRIWAFVISLGQWVFLCKWQPSPSAKYAVTKKKLGVVKTKRRKRRDGDEVPAGTGMCSGGGVELRQGTKVGDTGLRFQIQGHGG
jgi:hypothetical protein